MKELWENAFANAHLKVERANKHISDIEKRLQASSDGYGPSLKIDGKTGEQFLYYGLTDRTLRSDIALIVGDAVHNLHSALDIAWCGTQEVVTSRTKFPIYAKDGRESFESQFRGKIASPLLDLLANRVKPYSGGDGDILAIRALDVSDKHFLLIPMLTVSEIRGVELENEDGIIDQFDIALTRPSSYRKKVLPSAKLKYHGDITFSVKFREGTPCEGLEVIPTLRGFSVKVRRIVMILQRMDNHYPPIKRGTFG